MILQTAHILVAAGVRLVNFGSFTFFVRLLDAVEKNGNVPKCGLAGVGSAVRLCLLCLSMLARNRVACNDLRLKEVGDFEVQTFFWKPQFKCKTNFH